MAESRGVRAASRRKIPTPQPERAPARATRRLRSASRDIEPVPEHQKPARRNVRQASVTSIASEGEDEGLKKRKTKRKPAKEPVRDLTIVEEIDTEIALGQAPGTPQRVEIDLDQQALFRSPGAASEMSGTTAISSFSMIEAEFLEQKFILKHMRKLCDAADEFLQHLAPENGTIDDDHRNIREIQKPDSNYAEEYRDFEDELNVHLKHFKSEEHKYIYPRAVHRALFGSYNDVGALQSGVDLVFYLTNLLVFAKEMIYSDRGGKDVWNTLRQLDNTFPSHFMRSLLSEGPPTAAGDSVLVKETFDLGLELRTQLAIMLLERSAHESTFNPDEALSEVFLHSEASQENGDIIRGWSVAALGGEETSLSEVYQNRIVVRLNEMKAFFPTDSQSLENGDVVDLDGLCANFPWEATILQFLQWVRLRHHELGTSIKAMGGPTTILASVKRAMEAPQPATEDTRPTAAHRDSLHKKRPSFGRQRRRSSRKFDPNAPIDIRAIDALKARERDSGVHFNSKALQPGEEFEQVAEEEDIAHQTVEDLPVSNTAPEEPQAEQAELVEQDKQIEEDSWQPTLGDQGDVTLVAGEDDIEEIVPSGPPKSTQDTLDALRSVMAPGKENRKGSLFDRQVTAQRVEFGNGFDSSQPTPGPSDRVLDKGKQRADPPSSVSRKRPRVEEDSDEDDDSFEAGERTARVQDRRVKAPVSKKVRLEPPSSATAPPSHQPIRPPADEQLPIPQRRQPRAPAPTAALLEQEDSVSETEAPNMTEEIPPSTYQDQHRLAIQNSAIGGAGRARIRRTWSSDAEEAFVEYMEKLPRSYSKIKEHDDSPDGYGLLRDFTQVNLKDKARTMAVNMIKSGTGLRPGFEGIVTLLTKEGQKLAEAGFEW